MARPIDKVRGRNLAPITGKSLKFMLKNHNSQKVIRVDIIQQGLIIYGFTGQSARVTLRIAFAKVSVGDKLSLATS
jgi:hypothetical protein